MTGTTVYAIWATNGKEKKEKIFFNKKKAHNAAVACKRKGLKFFAGAFYTNYCGGKTKYGIGIDNKMDVEETDALINHFCQKIEWFCRNLDNKQFSTFGVTD